MHDSSAGIEKALRLAREFANELAGEYSVAVSHDRHDGPYVDVFFGIVSAREPGHGHHVFDASGAVYTRGIGDTYGYNITKGEYVRYGAKAS